MTTHNFDDTRPFENAEIPDALKRVSNHFYFPIIVHYLFPDEDINSYKKDFFKINYVHSEIII